MSIPRYTVTSDGLQDDPHGFLARWYDVERLQAEVERLTADRDYHRNTSEARIAAVTRAHKREDKKQATIDRLTADLAAARSERDGVAKEAERIAGLRLAAEAERDQARAELNEARSELEAKHRAWNHAVQEGARLGRERDEARAQAEGLAKALRIIRDARARSATDLDAIGEVQRLADAALAALPTEEADDA